MGSPKAGDPRLAAVLAVAAVVFFGLAVWLYLSGRPPGDGSPEAGFARDMIVHHAQAVEMAEIVRDRTENEEIRILATDIALTQQAQMGHPMEGMMPGMASSEEVNRLRKLPPEEADELFLRLMIEHHRAAIPMAESVLEQSNHPAVEELARAIASSQRGEIETMQVMLETMGAPPVEDEESMPMEDGGHVGGHHGGDHHGGDHHDE